MGLYLDLEAFPDVPAVLAALRRAGFITAILSNGTPAMLAAAVAAAGLGDMFDAVMSVEEVGAFKPVRRVYQLATAGSAAPGAIAFVSSNAWDVMPPRPLACGRYGAIAWRFAGSDCQAPPIAKSAA